ncbi:MAG TPA: hypothetical protein VJW20_16885 [Candidatus Angelobacter sp.]|nr:hypothetical protein [Candidatus Angelobacter sp.]
MDFSKLVSLLDSRCLYFARADKLGDPFEGSWPQLNIRPRQSSDGREIQPIGHTDIRKMWTKYVAINCWHINDHESAAMWKLYLQSNEGIAVQSSYKTLRDAIIDDEIVYLGVVKYIDYETHFLEPPGLALLGDPFATNLNPFIHKRKSFEHEREARALVLKLPIGKGHWDVKYGEETINHGLKVKVDLKQLVERVYVAPTAPEWFADLVRAVIKKYGYEFEVVHSKLDEQPVY